MVSFEDVKRIKRDMMVQLTPYQKRSFRGALTNEKLTGISVLNVKGGYFKENYHFIPSSFLSW